MQRRVWRGLMIISVVAVALVATAFFVFQYNSGALWQIVSQQCVPHQQQQGSPAPCQQVNLSDGYVVLKDKNGPLQYLLMPTARIHGIESPEVLQAATPNFFWQAWRLRGLLAEKRDAAIPDSALSLTINSPTGRSQNQLHIHISCLRPDVRQQIDRVSNTLKTHWQPETLRGHTWYLRAITPAELFYPSPFIRLHDELPQARDDMGKFGMALVALPSGNLVLLAIERNLLTLNRASAEELQDHACTIL